MIKKPKPDYQPTSRPSGIPKAPMETRYFIQYYNEKIGAWCFHLDRVYLNQEYGGTKPSNLKPVLDLLNSNPNIQFRIRPAKIYLQNE